MKFNCRVHGVIQGLGVCVSFVNSVFLCGYKKLMNSLLFSVLLFSCVSDKKSLTPIDKRVDSVMSLMTVEEKIGQLNLPSAGDFVTGQAENSDIGKKIENGLVGGLLNIK